MLSIIHSAALLGIDAYAVNVEVDLSSGLPAFDIVGLPDSAVKESRERVRTAIKNTGLSFPTKRITVNLAPADTKKEGAHLAHRCSTLSGDSMSVEWAPLSSTILRSICGFSSMGQGRRWSRLKGCSR